MKSLSRSRSSRSLRPGSFWAHELNLLFPSGGSFSCFGCEDGFVRALCCCAIELGVILVGTVLAGRATWLIWTVFGAKVAYFEINSRSEVNEEDFLGANLETVFSLFVFI